MRFLTNENVPSPVVATLRECGHDVVAVKETLPGATDRAVLERAHAEDRVVVTFDKDFGELAVRFQLPVVGVILLRAVRALRRTTHGPPLRSPVVTTGLGTSLW